MQFSTTDMGGGVLTSTLQIDDCAIHVDFGTDWTEEPDMLGNTLAL